MLIKGLIKGRVRAFTTLKASAPKAFAAFKASVFEAFAAPKASAAFKALALSLFLSAAFCGGSLAKETALKHYEPFTISLGSGAAKEEYIVMNSALDPYQWYCAKAKPVLYEYKSEKLKKLVPSFKLISFQKYGSKQQAKPSEGALVYCVFNIGATKKDISKLKSRLPKGVDKKRVRLEPMPFESIELAFYQKDGSLFNLTASSAQLINNENDALISFKGVLKGSDAAMFNSLLMGKSGIKYHIAYKYNVLSERQTKVFKTGFHKHFEAEGYNDKASLRDSRLINYLAALDKCPKNAVNQKFISAKQENINLSEAENTEARGKSFSLQKQIHKKKLVHINKTRQTVEGINKAVKLVCRTREQKAIVKNSILSLNDYGDDVKKELIYTFFSETDWNRSWLLAPTIRNIEDLDVKQIELTASLCLKNKVYDTQKIYKKGLSGWVNKYGEPSEILEFSLKALNADLGRSSQEKAYYRLHFNIEFIKDEKIEFESAENALSGDVPVSTPMAAVEAVEFDFSNLFWGEDESHKNRLLSAELILNDNSRLCRRTVMPQKRLDGSLKYPQSVFIPVEAGNYQNRKIKANLSFTTTLKKTKGVPWAFNGLKLYDYFKLPCIVLFDSDWQ